MKHSAFASFADSASARTALHQLHQLDVLGSRLVVVFARSEHLGLIPSCWQPKQRCEERNIAEQCHCSKLHPFLSSTGLAIPLTLPYKYPAVSAKVISRISLMLWRCPEFYTQVLHLMNKLCLPCPFDDAEYEDAQPSEYYEEESCAEYMLPTTKDKPLRSAAEVAARYARRLKLQLGQKRRFPNDQKKAIPPKLTKTPAKHSTIRVNVRKQLPSEPLQSVDVNPEPFGTFGPQRQVVVSDETSLQSDFDFSNLMSVEEIRRRCISRSEWKKWPAFNRYSPGEPSSRLYVKNLSKKVTELDLKRIYGNFVNATMEEGRQAFDVRLMQSGRLRGQAFISLGCIVQAQAAIRLTNGLMIHGKPLVVAFARSCRSELTASHSEE
ncbi:hypothetical protein D918_03283 [Trichuris suis]|nr:hypothetical protein D918_03283 [Trichuris suis]